jgi:hypothetical protein
MTAILNIGLKVSESIAKGVVMSSRDVLGLLQAFGIDVLDSTLAQSNSEPTLIAVVAEPLTGYQLETLSEILLQDCIAQFDTSTQSGTLEGPKADFWGPFNPKFFIMPEGERLAV